MTDTFFERYSRQIALSEIGRAGQMLLGQTAVLVVGAGGLGSPVLAYLAGCGIGRIGIVDSDRVEIHNLPRQIIFNENDIGKPKADTAAELLRKKNSLCDVRSFPDRLDATNARELIASFDLVLDCSDNFPTRYIVNDACALLKKPCIHGALFRFEGQVAVINHAKSETTYRSLFDEAEGKDHVQSCSETGMLGMVSGITGIIQASEAVKYILGLTDPTSARMLLVDVMSMQTTALAVEHNRTAESRRPHSWEAFLQHDYRSFEVCETYETDIKDLAFDFTEECILDVRELHEQDAAPIPCAIAISLFDLKHQFHSIPRNKRLITVCDSGNRSKVAAKILRDELGFTKVFSLRNGSNELIEQLKNKAYP